MKFLNFIKKDRKKSQKGSIIIYTIIIMMVVLTIALALMRLLLPKFRIAKESVYSAVALYAADSGMEWCIFSNRTDPSVQTIPNQPVALTTISSAVIQIYDNYSAPPCSYDGLVGFRSVGTYRGISRSLETF